MRAASPGMPTLCWLALGIICAQTNGQGLPPVPVPDENPITAEKAVLGKILFWEEQLSSDNTVSCGTCHRPAFGGTDPRLGLHPGPDGIHGFDDPETGIDDVIGSPGVIRAKAKGHYQPDLLFELEVQITGRSANPSIMAMYASDIFWDGRATDQFVEPQFGEVAIETGGALESQAVQPILSDVEMAHEARDWNAVIAKLETVAPLALGTQLPDDVAAALDGDPSYADLFERAFSSREITAQAIAFAIATYERTLVPDQTPFDLGTMTADQQEGFTLLEDHTVCFNCHVPPLFTDNDFHNIGLRPSDDDLGRMNVTGNNDDRGRFKTPTLRGVGLKVQNMHVGWITDLQDSIDFYNAGTQQTRHRQFTQDQDRIPPGNGDYNRINMPEMVGNIPFQERVIDFITNALTDPRVAAATYPFDRPTLHTETDPNPAVSGDGTPGTGGIVPRMIALTPPNVGSDDFKIGLADGLGGAEAYVAMSHTPPVDGVIEAEELYGAFVLQGAGAGAGYTTWLSPIPDDARLIGDEVYLQWFVTDPGADGGTARSTVAALTIFCHRGCPCLGDLDSGGSVGFEDLLAVLAAWGPCDDCPEDLDRNGVVGFEDLLVVLGAWGLCL